MSASNGGCRGFFYCGVALSEHLQVQAEITGNVRTETVMGRTHKVFPAVLVREQVLNNNLGRTFLPAKEIKASVDAWNGMPVVVRHPSKRGQLVSARDPEVLNARGVGQVFNARFDNGALKADVFVEVARARNVKDAGDMVQNVERGQPGELSTGFATMREKREGTHNGERFEAVLRSLRPDHLALLPSETGACSVSDGCGLGVNHDGSCNCETDDRGRLTQAIEKLVAFMGRIGPAQPDGEEQMDREQVIAALREAGCPLNEERLGELEEEELTALQESFSTNDESEPAEEKSAENKAENGMAEKIAVLEQQVAELAAEREQERADLIATLAKNERCPFEQDELDDFNLDRLQKLAQMAKVRNYAGRAGPRDTSNSEPTHMPVRPYWADSEEED